MAISVINQYCTSLLKSKFACLSPIWTLRKISKDNLPMYQVLEAEIF